MSQPKDQIHTTESKRQKLLALIEAVDRLNQVKDRIDRDMLMHEIESIKELAREAEACITLGNEQRNYSWYQKP